MRDGTRLVRAMLTPAVAGEAMHGGPVFAAPFHVPGDVEGVAYSYGRAHNPTWTALEGALGRMESGEGYAARALIFSSGMAAVAAVFGSVLRPGDAVVLPSDGYFSARLLAEEFFARMGAEVRLAPTAGDAQGELVEGARLLWLETPSNPGMEVCDIAALCERAHRAGCLVACDNTTATPFGQRVLELGADFSVVSDTKSVTGHGDLLLGHVAVKDRPGSVERGTAGETFGSSDERTELSYEGFRRSRVRTEADGEIGRDSILGEERGALGGHQPGLWEGLERWRTLTGSIAGPMEAWLAGRSLATLPLRLERSCANAMRIAEFLCGRREVGRVMYPGLPTHPGHRVAARQMRSFGPVLSFVLRDRGAAERFLRTAELVTDATSFGGVVTTAERRARWGHDAIEEGFLRMSAGLEDVEDLLEDMGRALEAAG